MPINTSNLQKNIQAPQVATGQALDASDMIKQALAPAFNTIQKIDRLGNSIEKYQVAKQRSDSQKQAQDAMNAYLSGREQLNTQMSQMQLEEAVAFKDKYFQQANDLHQKFLSAIASIRDSDIRENARQRINSYNMKTAASTEAYVYKQEEAAKDMTLNASNDNTIKMAGTAVSPLISDQVNVANFSETIADGVGDIINRYAQKGAPEPVINAAVQEFKMKAAEQAAQTLATSPLGYGQVLRFINTLGANGEITNADKVKMLRKYEDQQLDYLFAQNQDAFRKPNGEFDEKLAAALAPNLTNEERFKKLKELSSASAANGGNLSGGQYGAIAEVNRAYNDYKVTAFANAGLANLLSDDELAYLGVKKSKGYEDFWKDQEDKRKNNNAYNPTNIMNLMDMVRVGDNTKIIWKGEGQFDVTANSKQIKEAEANGWRIINKPTAEDDSKLYVALSSELRNMIEGDDYKKSVQNKILSGASPSAQEVVDTITAGMLYKLYDNRGVFRKLKDWVQGKSLDTQPFTAYMGTMTGVRRAAAEELSKIGFSMQSNFDSIPNKAKEQIMQKMAIASAMSLSDEQLKSLALDNVTKDETGNVLSVEGGDKVMLDFYENATIPSIYDVIGDSTTDKLRFVANPIVPAIKYNYRLGKWAYNRYNQWARYAYDERFNGPMYKNQKVGTGLKPAVIKPDTSTPVMYGLEAGQPRLHNDKKRSTYRFNLLTGEEYEDYSGL